MSDKCYCLGAEQLAAESKEGIREPAHLPQSDHTQHAQEPVSARLEICVPGQTAEPPPSYLPQPGDENPKPLGGTMGPIGPWATGKVDWSPLAGLTGTRPVVDRYSITRYSDAEWKRHNMYKIGVADDEIHRANMIAFNSRRCMEQTAASGDRNQLDNTKRLSQRAQDLHRWKFELERSIVAMANELIALEGERQRLKTALGVLQIPEAIAGECLELRSSRMEPDLCRDGPEEELIREVALVNECRDLMNRILKQMEEQLEHNKAAKMRLEMDWSDKKEAYDFESMNIGLTNTSPVIQFKAGSARLQDQQSTPETWEASTRENLSLTEAERGRSKDLRSMLNVMLTDMTRDLRTQADRVNAALANKISLLDECRTKLENNLKVTLKSIADTEILLGTFRAQIRAQDLALKVAQTRMANRQLRPRAENCRDVPNFGLLDEIKAITENVAALTAQMNQAQDSLTTLNKSRGELEKEICVKRKTLHIDRDRIGEIRSYYPSVTALAGH